MKIPNVNTSYFIAISLFFAANLNLQAEDGYKLWLRYAPLENPQLDVPYASQVVVPGGSPTMEAIRSELKKGLGGMLGHDVALSDHVTGNGAIVVGTPASSPLIASLGLQAKLQGLGHDGYLIYSAANGGHAMTVIASSSEVGALYGTFHFLRLMQTRQQIAHLDISEKPAFQRRFMDHWDNPDGSIERGYAGNSLWRWNDLPGKLDPRYIDYARAEASLGLNGVVLNNVNAKPEQLTPEYLRKAAALANVFRPYGIRVYLAANFAAPIAIGNLKTADPLDPTVQKWWQAKADEIYRLIPDFGGFLVKANSEKQPGPQDYGRTHADGANMLAEAVAPRGGIVMWRAFVYASMKSNEDRATAAYKQFTPLDGKFRGNVFVQVKNGPIDFQPREMFHPLIGAMRKTPLLAELQITQEYLGHETDLVYLAPLWKEFLDSDTYRNGPGSTVAKILASSPMTAIAGVANTGSDTNWCGQDFAQANWYAYGRLAWNSNLTAEQIAEEWARMTWGNDPQVISTVCAMMRGSRDACVNYEMPLGLTDMEDNTHYGANPPRHANYHQADAQGIGYDRGRTGSDAVSEYAPAVGERYANLATCPDDLLLWFHHVSWDYKMKSGRTVWDELCFRYNAGVDYVKQMQTQWQTLRGKIDPERFSAVQARLDQQLAHATNWRDVCIRYFQSINHKPLPAYLAQSKG
ncbi:MAG TPA: alpha-glucuronidase family glycosyl hydrolase [Candidatus Methylacidiphilales bacterium]|nr:alpha-glucuronidase family glycosyl hydrolase [Candidatus Methylacidiphilales bacterium]